jgi:hypothetical protein
VSGATLARLVLALGALLTLGWAVERVAARGRFAAPYSIHGGGPSGTRALAELLRSEGFRVRPLTHEIAELGPGALIAVSGCAAAQLRDLTRLERERLARFVDAGGLLVVVGAFDFIPEALGIRVADRADCLGTPPPRVRAQAAGAPLAHLLPFLVEAPATLDALPFADATPLLSSGAGALGFTALSGRGRVVVLGIPEALTNRNLALGGGAVLVRLLRAFAPQGPVWFDEFHLGLGERRSLTRYLRDRGLAPSLVQLLLVLVAALGVARLRLLPVRERPAEAPRSPLAHALARLYARTGQLAAARERAGLPPPDIRAPGAEDPP